MPDVKARARSAHRVSVQWDLDHIAKYLQDQLGQKLVGHIAKADPKTVGHWARGEQRPRAETEKRIRMAFQVFHLLLGEDDAHTVRAWFIGINPQLDDQAPADAIREDRLGDVWVAAQAYIAGG
ncbi:MAG: XRE family transcriptional regulator [Acidimicrobiales bacterium]